MNNTDHGYFVYLDDQNSGNEILKIVDVDEIPPVEGACGGNIPATCVAVPSSSLFWHVHGQHVYRAVIRVKTIAGHYSDTRSEPYYHSYGPPYPGTVWVAALSGKVSYILDKNLINFCMYT